MIVRRLTADSPGAVAVIELRGAGARARAQELAPALASARSGALLLASLRQGSEVRDHALVWVASDELVELHLHGSPLLVDAVLRSLQPHPEGACCALSLEARAQERLVRSVTDSAARILLDQVQGALRRELEALLSCHRHCAALARLEALSLVSHHSRACFEPLRVALVGPVNSGKSTLFNALAGAERAIVSASPGSTRDVLSADVRLGAWPAVLIDTAGERTLLGDDPRSRLERAGQELGARVRSGVDLVLRLWPGDGPAPSSPRAPSNPPEVWVESRADLAATALAGCDARIAAGADPHGAARVVGELFVQAMGLPRQPWSPGAAVAFDEASRCRLSEALCAARNGDERWRSSLRAMLLD